MSSQLDRAGIRVTGVDLAIAAINKKITGLIDVSKAQLITLGLGVQRRAQEYITEDHLIDTGNLRASAYTIWSGGPGGTMPQFSSTGNKTGAKSEAYLQTLDSGMASALGFAMAEAGDVAEREVVVMVGFGAFYALFVHEDGVSRSWTGSKFLERAVLDAKSDLKEAFVGAMKRA